MARRANQSKTSILDAAESLFAKRGFYGVSMRQIARAAEVDMALIHYHFGKKKELFETVVLRRAEALNEERLERLEACVRYAAPAAPSVEAIIDAFVQPLVHRSVRGGPGWKSYFAMVGQVSNNPEFGGNVMSSHFDPLVRRFIEVLRAALPNCDDRDLFWCYHFLAGALTLTFAETGRIDGLSDGLCQSTDLHSIYKRLVPYTAAGFRRVCGGSAAQPESPPDTAIASA